jgi:hypothetical protein
MRVAPVIALGLLSLLPGPRRPAPAAETTVTARTHHLRVGAAREWADFPADAEGAALVVPFESAANRTERTLSLRHRDVKQSWRVVINGAAIATLAADEADTISYLAVPPGGLRDGANELRIEGSGTASDDVLVGPIAILDRRRATVLSEATIDVSVRQAPRGEALPCRITVVDAQGALIALGTATDSAHAVRPGVVYTGTGDARLALPAGRYAIYAGRGFEYSVDRVDVVLAPGDHAARRLTIRREVDTAGWAAMDTHVHTGTYARHGDATIDERMLTLAGEGIELPVSTEHNTRVDFEPRARAAGVRTAFTPLVGTEVTTPALGHFNVFPVAVDGPAIDQRAPDWARLRASIEAATAHPIIVLNHGRDEHGGFRPLDARRHVGVAGEDLDGWPQPANAMEILNSGAVLSDALALARDWLGFLNRGLRLTPVGSSDSHDVTRYIVGQGRTYVRCDDRQPSAIGEAAVLDSLRGGRVRVSYGLLADIDVSGHGPGELVAGGAPLAVRVRVQGPGWTRARHVTLYMDGTPVREAEIAGGASAGVKWQRTWRLPAPSHDVHLVAVATGPGVTAPYWPTAKPYQPTSPEFTPYVLGVSGAVFVDADGSGAFDSALDYARREIAASAEPRRLAAALARYDEAIATQAASLLRGRDPAGFDLAIEAMLPGAAPQVARGLRAYRDAWRASR